MQAYDRMSLEEKPNAAPLGTGAFARSFTKPWSTFSVKNAVFPIDHQVEFYLAVGAAKGKKALKEHVMQLLTSWTLVSSLIFGAALAMVDSFQSYAWHNETGHSEYIRVAGSVGTTLSVGTAFCALVGPIVMGSVLLNNCKACGDVNFDLLIRSCQAAFTFNEVLIVCMCYGGLLAVIALLWVVIENALIALVSTCVALMIILKLIYHINTLSAVNLYGGLMHEERRALPDVAIFDYNMEDRESARQQITDSLVRKTLSYDSEWQMLSDYTRLRAETPRPRG